MTILFIILALLSIPFIMAIFQSDEFVIEQQLNINKPKRTVFDYIVILKNSDKYNKWVMTDPNMKKDYKGTDGKEGFVYYWESENKQVGKGEQEVKRIIDGQRIDYEIRFIKPFANVSTSSLILESISDNQTNVKWTFEGKKNYMMKLMHMVFKLSNMLSKDLATSLLNLKTILEKQ